MRITDIQQRLQALGAKPVHQQRVLRHWTHALPHSRNKRQPEHWLPKAVLDDLPALDATLAGLVRLVSRPPAEDGSERLLLALADGQTVESVLLPATGKSHGVCVSTQVGCAVGCKFCASGLFGVARNLDANEIFEQVVHARRRLPTDRVVYMGMGEPSHNLDAVLEAVARIRDVGQISGKKQVVSTVGSVKAIARMQAAAVRPCLAEPERPNCAIGTDRILPFLGTGNLLQLGSGNSSSADVAFAGEAHRLEQGPLRSFTPFRPLRWWPPEVCLQTLLHLRVPKLGQDLLREG